MEREKLIKRLIIKCFDIHSVNISKKNGIDKNKMLIDKDCVNQLMQQEKDIKNVNINIIKPREHNCRIDTIMDFIPISTKVLGRIGEGITHTLTGVYVMLTGVNTKGVQMSGFGSTDGYLKDNLKLGCPGTPEEDDYIIHFNVVLKGDVPTTRELSLVAHRACDIFIQQFRNILKMKDGRLADEIHEYVERKSENKKRIVVIKQVAGQGAFHDNIILPAEPSGVKGGRSIIDMGNVPVILSPNEYRDGAIRAMT